MQFSRSFAVCSHSMSSWCMLLVELQFLHVVFLFVFECISPGMFIVCDVVH